MTMKGFQHYKLREYVSCSSLSACGRCPRLMFFRNGCRLQSPGPKHPALVFGGAADKAFGVTLTQGLDMGMMEFLQAWGDGDDIYDDKKRNSTVALKMLDTFVSTPKPYSIIDTPESVQKTAREHRRSQYEIPFMVDVGAELPFGGLVDGLCTHRETGEMWVLEFKTTSQLGSWYFNAFNLSTQAIGYAVACRILGLDVKGVMVDANLVAKTRSESMVVPVSVPPVQEEMWLKWANKTVKEIKKSEQEQDFEQRLSGCNTYNAFGQQGFPCSYTDLCKAADWTSLLEMYEVSERVDPLKTMLTE